MYDTRWGGPWQSAFGSAPSAKNGKIINLCSVDVGTSTQQIVCGASNFTPGDYVLVALPGSRLPGGIEIQIRKVYGFESCGMILSAEELSLQDYAGFASSLGGIIVLDEKTMKGVGLDALLPGTPLQNYLVQQMELILM